jgi:hypothetical protein
MAAQVRLPTPGGDEGGWGNVLNTFLKVEHNTNGTLKKASLIVGAEQTANKNQPGGYVGMGNNGVIDSNYLPSNGVGSYMGVQMYSVAVTSGVRIFGVPFDGTTDSFGTTLTWDAGDPSRVTPQSEGVYAVTVTVDWNDQADTTNSSRFVQLYSQCQFHVEEQRASATGVSTVQCISMTVLLRELQDMQVFVQQDSGGDLTPNILMLVTKVAHTHLPI